MLESTTIEAQIFILELLFILECKDELLLERNLRITTRTNAIVMITATIQKRCDKPAPMSSKFSWFFTIIGVSKKLRAIPIWVPNMLNDVAVESSLPANHCAARRPGNVRIIVYNVWMFIWTFRVCRATTLHANRCKIFFLQNTYSEQMIVTFCVNAAFFNNISQLKLFKPSSLNFFSE